MTSSARRLRCSCALMDVAQIKVDVAALQTEVTQINARNTIH